MAQTAVLSFRMPADLKAGLVKEALTQERSVSSMVESILRTWLEDRRP